MRCQNPIKHQAIKFEETDLMPFSLEKGKMKDLWGYIDGQTAGNS